MKLCNKIHSSNTIVNTIIKPDDDKFESNFTIDLAKITKTKVHFKSENLIKFYDQFMITPACHSEYIAIDYFLNVNINYQGCCS